MKASTCNVAQCSNVQVDAPSVMHMITPPLKTRMAEELKPILEEWYGHGPLKMTSIYGVRKYTVSEQWQRLLLG